MTRTILIDADILAYRSSAATQRVYEWDGKGNGKSYAADLDEATQEAERQVNHLIDRLQPDNVIVCLSDDFSSFRKDRVDPTYKSVRSTTERPQLLYEVKDWLRSQYETEERTALEADDVMGIIATDPNRTDERIIVSADKDMKTVPGLLYRPQDQKGEKPKLQRVTPEEAARFHLWQTIVGDTTDGYPGLPGAGPKEADRVLDGALWKRHERVILRGPNKGQTREEWLTIEHDGPAWERVVAAYHKRGLTEKHALVQARLARILQWSDYDGRSPRLWTPTVH